MGMYNEIIYQELYKFKSVEKKPVIIDVGSNIGISILYFNELFPNSKIIGIEADPTVFGILKKNTENIKSDLELHNKAVWNSENEILQFGSTGADAGSLFAKENLINVETICLSSILKKYEEIDMLKIDIEGAEKEVIEECKNYLNRVKHIFVEFHSFPEMPQELENILKTISSLGFRYKVLPARKEKNPFIKTTNPPEMDLQLNLFFYK